MINSKFFNFLALSWVIVILLQFMRIEFAIIYFPILIFFLILNTYIIIVQGHIFNPISYVSFHIWIFYILIIYIAAMTFFVGNLNDFLRALPRMTLMPITLIYLYNFITSKKQFEKIINIYIFFGAIGAISIFYQIFFGSLSFLVETHEREGLERYASTLGSLNALGGAVGVIMLTILLKNKNFNFLNFFIFFLIGLAGVMSLSKAGFANVVLVLLWSIFILDKRKIIPLLLGAIIFTWIFYIMFPDIKDYMDAAYNGLSIGEEEVNSSFEYQTFDRLLGFMKNLGSHSIWNNFFGWGLIGGSGAFGLPFGASGTTHNQYAEFFNIGGVFLFVNVLSLFVCLMIKLYKLKKKDYLSRLFFHCNLLAMINMFFFNGFLYAPSTSFVLWLSMVYVLIYQEKNNEKNI